MKVTNPLTVVSIFAGLAESFATVVLLALPEATQVIFVWYVMCFPVILVSLFFLILYLKPQVFYSPSDFPNPADYMKTLPPILRLKDDVMYVQEKVQESGGDNDAIVNMQNILNSIVDKIDHQLVQEIQGASRINSSLEKRGAVMAAERMILAFMQASVRDVEDIQMVAFCNAAPYARPTMERALKDLLDAGTVLVEPHPTGKNEYALASRRSKRPST